MYKRLYYTDLYIDRLGKFLRRRIEELKGELERKSYVTSEAVEI